MDVHSGLLLTTYHAALSVPRTNHASVTPVLVLYAVSAGLAVGPPQLVIGPFPDDDHGGAVVDGGRRADEEAVAYAPQGAASAADG
jgi:hypothetical protein